jgi:hypothetical protein
MQRFARILLLASILLNVFLIFKFVNHHYINMNNIEYVDTRVNVYVQTKNCKRDFDKIQQLFPNAMAIADEPCTRREHIFKSYIEEIDKSHMRLKYAYKYIETLKICQQGDKMLCMILEDDVLFINNNETIWNNIALNTLAMFANENTFWDCSTRRLWFGRGSGGDKTLCRIYSTERLPTFIQCLEGYLRSTLDAQETGIDVLINKCQVDLGINQKRFLLVNHSGQKSLLGQ